MSSTIGDTLRLTLFGRSHGPVIGMTLAGIPAGKALSPAALQAFLDRRAPGRSPLSTARREADVPRFLSGLNGGVTTGEDITAVIENTDVRSADYEILSAVPRPGHADYTAYVKYGRIEPGGGPFSGRMTAALCIAGGICLQLLGQAGISVLSRIRSIGPVNDRGQLLSSTADKPFPVVDEAQGEAMAQAILEAKAAGDSLGGVIECRILGVPAGVGGPLFDGLESRLSAAVFGIRDAIAKNVELPALFAIPAVKGVDFGSGFDAARLRGSENNDPFVLDDNGKIVTETNHCGGILGGISTGMCIDFRVAIKPTPSIALPQRSVDLKKMQPVTLQVSGRHDPCIVPRAVPCVEAAAAFAIYDAMLSDRKETEHESH